MRHTCPLHVLWLQGAVGTLACISWQMGHSAPQLLFVMMSHIPVYEEGHTQPPPHSSSTKITSSFASVTPSSSFCPCLTMFSRQTLTLHPSGNHCPLSIFTSNHHASRWNLHAQLQLYQSFVVLWGKPGLHLQHGTAC